MQTPETVLKTQRSLAALHGTKKIAAGLILISCLLASIELAVDSDGPSHRLRSLGSWLSLLSVATGLYVTCARRASDLERTIDEEAA